VCVPWGVEAAEVPFADRKVCELPWQMLHSPPFSVAERHWVSTKRLSLSLTSAIHHPGNVISIAVCGVPVSDLRPCAAGVVRIVNSKVGHLHGATQCKGKLLIERGERSGNRDLIKMMRVHKLALSKGRKY
jgi:hypothetical protein